MSEMPNPARLSEALDHLKPSLLALEAERLRHVHLAKERIVELSSQYLASWALVDPLLERSFNPTTTAEIRALHEGLMLRAYAHAGACLAAESAVAPEKVQRCATLLTELGGKRKFLQRHAEAYFIDNTAIAPELRRLRSGRGKLDLAQDVIGYATLLAANFARIPGTPPFTPAELAQLEADGTELFALLTAYDTKDRLVARSFTAWSEAATRLRKVALFVLERDDAEELFPGLSAKQVHHRTPASPQA